MTTSRSLAFFTAIGLLAGCSGVRQPMLPSSNAVVPSETLRASGRLVVRVRLQRPELAPHYIGASTKGMTVDIVGPTNAKKTVGLTVTAKGCKSSLMSLACTLVVPNLTACSSKKPCYSATVKTYDAFANGHIPHGAHELSADEGFSFNIGSASATIPLVLQGIPKNVLVAPDMNSTIAGNQRLGFIEPKCTAAVQKMNVVSLDADGNFIVGPGAPKVTLRSSNASQFGVARKSGNVFELLPPKAPSYPFGNVRVTLTAKAMPSKDSGGRSVTQGTRIAYSGDICGVITEFDVPSGPSSGTYGITAGPDGALWFTERNSNKIGRVTTSGKFQEFGGLTAAAQPFLITTGPDHKIWFTEITASKIGTMTTAGAVTEFPTKTATASPYEITAGPDGNIWFAEEVDKIGVMSTQGVTSEFPTPTSGATPTGITRGPDGALWFAEFNAGKIGRVTTSGGIQEFPVPTTGAGPVGIILGADNQLWFTELAGNKIGRLQTSAFSTTVDSEFEIPSSSSQPFGIAAGPDGTVWFTEQGGDRIDSVTPDGRITEYLVPTANSFPSGIAAGPDGAIWFAELNAGKIGRIR